MQLLDLPDELIFEQCQFLGDQDLVNFICTNKHFYGIGTEILKRRKINFDALPLREKVKYKLYRYLQANNAIKEYDDLSNHYMDVVGILLADIKFAKHLYWQVRLLHGRCIYDQLESVLYRFNQPYRDLYNFVSKCNIDTDQVQKRLQQLAIIV